jgi:hypothetical protein
MARSSLGATRCLLAAGLFLCVPATRAADAETRTFTVFVDDKATGEARMIFETGDDGVIVVRCDTAIKVKIGPFKAYGYKYRGQETWKGGRLQRFESSCDDDGTQYAVSAAADGDGLRVRVNGVERDARADVWLTSYWKQPDGKLIDKPVPLLDADTGRDLTARVQLIGTQNLAVAGDVQATRHFRLTGDVTVDLWYDGAGRLVRQEWMEGIHRTRLELKAVGP